MKLCSLYIENFGCLRGFELDFEAGLTTLSHPNGFGKTTLAEFIRAMFYGFPRKTKTLEKSKRQKYTPWSGGAFGGNLVFEHDGRRYRIERTFGAAPKMDTFALIDLATSRKSDRFSDEIGMELFGLDSDSFERSVYLPQQQEDETLTTASIQAKLTNLVEDSSDVGNYDNAMGLLRAKRSALIPYRGNGGTVAETAAQVTRLQMKLDQAQEQYERLTQLQSSAADTAQKLENTKQELAQLQQKLAAASEAAEQMVHRDHYHRLKQGFGQIETQIAALQAVYPLGIPELSELSAMEAVADKLAALENKLQKHEKYLPDIKEPELQEVLEKGRVFFIDELNARLHPLLVRNFILTFLNPKINTNHAQLVFTTHDTWQLSNQLLRRDEIWFVEKDDRGVSTLYSLADFVDEDGSRIRKDESYEKNYLIGKYGAIPTLKSIDIFRED